MHTCIHLHMDGEVGDSFFFRRLYQFRQQAEAIYLRLQAVVEHRLEGRQFGIHDDDRAGDARFAKLHSLVGHGYGQVIHLMVLQGFGNLVRAGSVSRGFYHAHHLGAWLQEAPIVVVVGYQCIEVNLKDGFVHLQFELLRHGVEVETACTLHQDDLVA